MPFVSIEESPLAPGVSPVEIYYREMGSGMPLVFLHGGWGYEIYPFDRQIEAFRERFRIIIPDRTGYGRSGWLADFPTDFHRRAAGETMRLLDALRIERAILWGHSDGAVIAAMLGLDAPERFYGLILEAFHFYRVKPGSHEFFEQMVMNPERLGERVCATLAEAHGADYWRTLLVMNGEAWLQIADESAHPRQDLYGGRLAELKTPAIFIHGSRDPRTEPDELDAIRRQLPGVPIRVIEEAGHSPHSERAAAESIRLAGEFLDAIGRESGL
ncbi:MAG TPA: alpha/beta hydrolase [Blastocatellia bacterium]|nr:alpha/beta hydrolase [Blastocatellia bacterium]